MILAMIPHILGMANASISFAHIGRLVSIYVEIAAEQLSSGTPLATSEKV